MVWAKREPDGRRALILAQLAPMERRALWNKWNEMRPFRNELMIRHIAATSATTDTRGTYRRNTQTDNTELRGGNDGKRAV